MKNKLKVCNVRQQNFHSIVENIHLNEVNIT